jgi:hypothetical protein
MHPNKRPRITPVATGVLFPKEIWHIILGIKHQDAIEEHLPRWKKQHATSMSPVLEELLKETTCIRKYVNIIGCRPVPESIRSYSPILESVPTRILYEHTRWIVSSSESTETSIRFCKQFGHCRVNGQNHGWVLDHSKKRGHRRGGLYNT